MLDPDWLCWCFDRAVKTFGVYVENQLDKAKSEREAKFILEGLLLSDKDEQTSHAIAPLMGQLGASADTPVPNLVQLLMDEDSNPKPSKG